MASGYSPSMSKDGGYNSEFRYRYSTSYNAATNTSTVTLFPQWKAEANWGSDTVMWRAGYGSNAGVRVNQETIWAFSSTVNDGNRFQTSGGYNEWAELNVLGSSIPTFTVTHDNDGNASFKLGIIGRIRSGYSPDNIRSDYEWPTGVTVEVTESRSLYVSYNANGGSGAPGKTYFYGTTESITLSATVPTRTGYTFKGWATSSSATTATYSAGQNIGTRTSNLTLYAVWQINTYTVSYKKGSYGTGTDTSATKTYNVALTLKGAIFTRTGYTQDGWSINSNGSTKDYNLSASYTANSAITLYPHWSLNTYKLTISQGSGSTISVNRTSSPIGGGSTGALSNNATIYYNDVLAISISANTGYDIGTHTVNGSNWTSGNHTVKGATSVVSTATKKTFKLTITQGSKSTATVNRTESPIGGASTGNLSTNATLYYNDKLKVTFSASGGYHVTTHTVNGSTFTSGNTHTATTAVTVVSAAAANTYTVKFNANRGTASGSGTMADQSYTYDAAQNLRTNTFTRYYTVSFDGNGITNPASQNASSTFNGWATSASGSKVYDNSQSVKNLTTTNNGTVNLYAVWTNGSVTLPTPTRAGYTFNGWYTAATGGTKIGNGGASYTPTAAITLHAQWTRINYKLTLTKSDTGVTVSVTRNGTALSNNATIYYGDSLTVTYTVTAGYEILTHTINGSNFTSPATVSVTGNTEVVVTVKTSAHVYIGDGTNWTAYQIYIGNGSGWDLYQAYIGDGTNWVAY